MFAVANNRTHAEHGSQDERTETMKLGDFYRQIGQTQFGPTSSMDPTQYYWGGRTRVDLATGEWKEIWHSSYRNLDADHSIVMWYDSFGVRFRTERHEGF
jgi:hypothetical protein